jgi:hypothetical protein
MEFRNGDKRLFNVFGTVMKIFEIFGLSRSGHHAMLNWVIKNITSYESEMKWKLQLMEDGLVYINEANLDTDITLKYIDEHKKNMRVLVLSYENCDLKYSILNKNYNYTSPLSINHDSVINFHNNYRIIFIRDFYDNLASRLKSNENGLAKDRNGNFVEWDTESNFIESWKESARYILNNKFLWLKFEDWLNDKKIRDEFMSKIIGHGELYDNEVTGTVSSFGDKNVIDRYSQIEIPQKTKDLIRQDSELHYLIGKLNYNYKKI